ncbi:MAG: hypothetical protein HY396_01875 [Candidatus Doudnabacteria bacterium]|nr:hypothetical protein [Candidatus Doudnabacteria bacterium]
MTSKENARFPQEPIEARENDKESLQNLLLQLEQIQRWLAEQARPSYQELIQARKSQNADLITEKELQLQDILDNSAILLVYTGKNAKLSNLVEQLCRQLQLNALAFDLVECMTKGSDVQILASNLLRANKTPG